MGEEQIGIKYVIDLGKLNTTIKAAEQKIKQFHNTIEQTSQKVSKKTSPAAEELRKLGITSDMTAKQIKGLGLNTLDMNRAFELTKKRMKELSAEVAGGGRSVGSAAKEYKQLQQRMPELEHEAQKGIKSFGDYRRAMDRWGAGFKYMIASQAAWIASGLVLFTVLRGIGQGLKDVITLHQEFKNLKAITQANAQEMMLMEDAIRNAAVGTKFFAADMSKSAKIMAQAGFSAREVADAIGAVAVLASATGRELEDVADLITTIIRAYDLNASESLRVANILAAGISSSKLQIEDMKTAFNYMGVAAKQFNISVEDTVAWLGVLRDRGLKASTVGTSFRGVLATLVRETQKFSKVLKGLPQDLGFSDISIRRGRKLEESMRRLSDAGFTMSDAFFGLRRRTAMTFGLMVKNIGAFETLRDKITGTNRAIEMNETAMEGLASQLAQTKSIFDEFMAAFTKSGGAMEPFVAGLKLIVKTLSTLLLGFSTVLDLIMRTGAAVAARQATPNMNLDQSMGLAEVPVPGDGGTSGLVQRGAITKAWKEDMVAIMDAYNKARVRIQGAGGLFGENLTTEQKETAALKSNLIKLNEELDTYLKQAEGLKENSAAWKDLQNKILPIAHAIREIETEIGFTDDAIQGSVKNLEDVMKDLIGKDVTREGLVGMFRKGAEDIDLMSKATNELRENFDKAFKKWKIQDFTQEGLGRVVEILKEWLEAQKKLDALKKAAAKSSKKDLDDEVKSEEKRFETSVKGYTRELKAIDKFTKEREKIDTSYAKFKRQIFKDLAKTNIDEFEQEKTLANEQHRERLRILNDLLEKAQKARDRLKMEVLGSPLKRGELEASEEQIKQMQAFLKIVGLLHKKEMELIADPKDMVGGIKKGFEEATKELANEYELWRNMTKETMMDMRDTMSDVFFDSMMGELKTAGDYWRAFTTSVKRQIANMAAQWIMSGLGGGGGGISWFDVGMTAVSAYAGTSTSADASAGLGADWNTQSSWHLGGLIKKYHTGGLKSNELLSILKNNEFVMRDSATRSIGTQNMEYMNRTGQMPQQQQAGPSVINHNYYVDAMDAQSFDIAMRTKGSRAIHDISLNSVARAKERGDRRVSR